MRNERGRPDDARGVAAFGQSLDGRRKQREKELGRGRLVHKHLEQHSHVARSVGTLHGWWAVPALRLRLLRQCLGRPAAAGAIVHPDIFGALADQAALGFAAQEAAQEAMLPVLTPDHYARSRRRLPLKFFGVQLGPDAVSRSWRWARRTNFVLRAGSRIARHLHHVLAPFRATSISQSKINAFQRAGNQILQLAAMFMISKRA
jgi:hypothetical protein